MHFITEKTSALLDAVYAFIAEKVGEEYAREAAPLSAFVGGFIWDALTLSRIDRWFDLSILTFYLIGSVFMLRLDHNGLLPAPFSLTKWLHKHAPFIFHFLIGGLFSAFVVFMFKSVTLSKSLIFFALVLAIFVLNEWAARRKTPLLARLSLINLAGSMYLVFVLPLVFGRIDYPVFLAAGIISGGLVFWIGRHLVLTHSEQNNTAFEIRRIGYMVTGMAVLLNIFYGLKWIPPVPLVLKDAILAIDVKRTSTGDYDIKTIETPWWIFWRDYQTTYSLSETPRLYCYASVFAPRQLNTDLMHEWQFKDAKKGWVQVDQMRYSISGGRDDGYRGYTYKSTLRIGLWRVQVKTPDGRLVGSIHFEITE